MYNVLKIEKFSRAAIAEGRINGVDITIPKIIATYDGYFSAKKLAMKFNNIHKTVCDEYGSDYTIRYEVEEF